MPTNTQPSPKKTASFQLPEVRIVEASAGSGKTYALAKRYVQLLLNPKLELEQIPIRNILAITFTNKASFEMKARILEFLKRFAFGQVSDEELEEILRPLGISREEAAKRSFAVMEEIIHNYNFFQVQTIDKFINALLSGCAFKIGLTANFKIKTNSRDYLEYALDELIDKAPGDRATAKIFEQFLHHYLYLENRTGWFPKEDILAIITTLFAQNNAYGIGFHESKIAPESIFKKKQLILEKLKAIKENLPEGADGRFVRSLEKFLDKHTSGFDVDALSEYFGYPEIPLRKNATAPESMHKLWAQLTVLIKELCEEEAFSLFNPYIDIFNRAREELMIRSAKDDVLFLEELNKRANFLFDEDYITVEELYYRLATRFRHYLIDEFQDTSRLQWRNIEKMAEEALSTGGSLFYVGDRKQAIYGFRGGDVRLFDEIKKRFNSFNVQIDFLTNNWRSQKNIVEFNNQVFSVENLRRFLDAKDDRDLKKRKKNAVTFGEDDFKTLEEIFRNSSQDYHSDNDRGYVKIERIEADRNDLRDAIVHEKVIALVKDLKKRFRERDIAILTRSNSDVEVLTSWLLEEGIPVESERTSNVRENPLVNELISLLKFLHSPIDNVSFASFIIGDIFSKATGISSEEFHHFVFGLRERLRNEKDLYLYIEFRKKYPKVWDEYLEEFFQRVGLYPLYELTVSIYGKLGCLKHFKDQQGFLMHFLELIKAKEEEYPDMDSFAQYFENIQGDDLYVKISDSDAIKILTVHKAKGLEFPVVILPFLGMDVQVGVSGENQQSYVLREMESGMELLRLKQKYLSYSDNLYQIYAREYKRALLSELNNIYVALTRPQCELYVFVPKKVGGSTNLVNFLIPDDVIEMGKPEKYTTKDRASDDIRTLTPSEYHDWIGYLEDEYLAFDEMKNRRRRLRGEVIHFMLSKVMDRKDVDLERIAQEARQQFAFVDDVNECRKKVEDILHSKALGVFFDLTDGEVFTEKEIVNARGHTKRVDRMILTKKDIAVVDFKSAPDAAGRYQKQVKEYVDIVKGLYPKHTVKGYLAYFDDLKVEDVQ